MSVPAETLRIQLRYTAWATARIVDAATKLSPDELTRNFGTADKSVLGTLVHTFAADRIWAGRVLGSIPARFLEVEKDMHLSVLQNDWPQVYEKWMGWANALDDAGAASPLHYQDLKGNQHTTPVWQVVMHVVNHATHHRGQAAGMIRTMGYAPPQLDMIAYYRSLG